MMFNKEESHMEGGAELAFLKMIDAEKGTLSRLTAGDRGISSTARAEADRLAEMINARKAADTTLNAKLTQMGLQGEKDTAHDAAETRAVVGEVGKGQHLLDAHFAELEGAAMAELKSTDDLSVTTGEAARIKDLERRAGDVLKLGRDGAGLASKNINKVVADGDMGMQILADSHVTPQLQTVMARRAQLGQTFGKIDEWTNEEEMEMRAQVAKVREKQHQAGE